MIHRLLLLALPWFLFAACGAASDEEGPLMRPGENCLSCHDGTQHEAERYTVAGTVFGSATAATAAGVSGVTVIITDANHAEARLTTNAAGNFYTSQVFAAPYTVAVERSGTRFTMAAAPSSGGCASCHSTPPTGGAPGRVYATP
jgi:hypothetical protein